ncbi:MAG: phosphatidylserine decarboxylase family protein, partial [Deltaproteobacteria bacterium CG_4_10_14_3_um_filter_60_8]
MIERHIPVAREGYPFIGLAAYVALLTAILGYDLLALAALFCTA